MARGKAHDPETKAAVMAALLTGQSVSEVARTYHLNKATVIAWRDAAGLGSTTVQPESRAEIGELVVDYLRAVLGTLAVQARVFGEESWIKQQDAADAAVLHGVLTDKAFRLLEALDPGDGDAGDHA